MRRRACLTAPLLRAALRRPLRHARASASSPRASTSTSGRAIRSTTTCRSPSISRAGAASRSSPIPGSPQLTRAVRPRDRHVEAVIGAASGQATFHLVREFHGLSTTIAEHAAKAQSQFGREADAITVPMLTLAASCASMYAPPAFEFLKVDVEGAEPDVLLDGDWQKFRPEGDHRRGARPLHARAGLRAMGAVPGPARLSLRAVRQPQPLLPRGGSQRSRARVRKRASLVRREAAVPQRQACARRHGASRPPARDGPRPQPR